MAGGNAKLYSHSRKQFGNFLKKQNIHLPFKTQQSHSCSFILEKWKHVYTKPRVCTNVHSNLNCKSQKLETTQVFFSRGMVQQAVVYPYHGLLLSNKKKNRLLIMWQPGWISRVSCWVKKWISKGYIPHDFIFVTFSKWQRDKRLVVTRVYSWVQEGERVDVTVRGGIRDILELMEQFYILAVLVVTRIHKCEKNAKKYRYTQTQMCACRTSEIWLCSVDYTHVSFPVLLYFGYVRCYQWGKMGEEYTGPLYYFCNFP